MAGLEERSGRYRIFFRYHGKQRTFPLGKVSRDEAEAKSAQVDYLLMRLKQRLIELPPGIDIVDFLQHDGRPPADVQAVPAEMRQLTLADFRDRYLTTHRDSLEERTIEGIELHFKHLATALGERFPIRELKLSDLQDYVDRRAKAKGMGGKRLSAATIKKEIVTLRTAWNWAEKMTLVAGRFPYHGLRYPKSDEKPPFATIRGDRASHRRRRTHRRSDERAVGMPLSPGIGDRGIAGPCQRACRPSVDLPANLHGRPYRGQAKRADPDGSNRCGFRGRQRHHPREEAGEGETLDPPGTADTAASGYS